MSIVQAAQMQSQGLVSRRGAKADDAIVSSPMMEINTTPLIDVMLVLLIMLIITIPPQNHDVKADLPVGPPPITHLDPLKNQLVVAADGQLRWNGVAMDDRQVRAMLIASTEMEPRPELHFQPDAAARYERVDGVMAMVKQSGVTAFGFVGNEQYRDSF